MSVKTKLQNFLHERAMRKYRETNLNGAREDLFTQISHVGILFDANESQDRDAVLDYAERLRAEGIKVWLFGYFNSKIEGVTFKFDYIDLSQLNFSFLPKGEKIKAFIETPFDLLINLDTSVHAPLNYVAAASKAQFKIGPSKGNAMHYDLMIESREKELGKYIDQIRMIFNKIA